MDPVGFCGGCVVLAFRAFVLLVGVLLLWRKLSRDSIGM